MTSEGLTIFRSANEGFRPPARRGAFDRASLPRIASRMRPPGREQNEREKMKFRYGHPGVGIAAARCRKALGAVSHALLACSLLAVSAHSAREYYKYDGASTWETVNYINFYTTVNPGVDHWETGSFSTTSGVKYYDFSLSIPSGTACFEIETQAAEGDPSSNDTRIWTYDGGFKSLDDDTGPGLYSKARVFLSGSAKVPIWFAAYSSNYNTMKFETRIRRLNLAEASCTTGQSLPWIKKANAVITYSGNAN